VCGGCGVFLPDETKEFNHGGGEKKPRKRVRTDTFWNYSNEENADHFGKIFTGEDKTYTLDKTALVKYDHNGVKQCCWRVNSLKTGNAADNIRSTKPYRLALLWSIYSVKEYWPTEGERLKLISDLPAINGKHGDHCRHRCGYDWCCNPRHITIGTRVDNEKDKHYHFFLNHPDPSVRERFIESFPELLESQGVW